MSQTFQPGDRVIWPKESAPQNPHGTVVNTEPSTHHDPVRDYTAVEILFDGYDWTFGVFAWALIHEENQP